MPRQSSIRYIKAVGAKLAHRSPYIVIAAVVAYALVRLSGTAEYTAEYGDARRRQDLCRAVPELPAWRQKRLLPKLLADEEDDVRLSAMTAAQRSPAAPEVDEIIEDMLVDESASDDVRTRAGEVLLSRENVSDDVAEFIEPRAEDPEFRRRFPTLVSKYSEARLAKATRDEKRAIVTQSLNERDPTRHDMRRVVLDNITAFGECRDLFVDGLAEDRPFETQQYAIAALTAVDGALRGAHADDWKQRELPTLEPGKPFVYEVEWAYDIRPNYHITEVDGVTCLGLGEGAGGIMHWLKGESGTVDVGTARLNLLAPADGTYNLWARVYFMDKCGNSFGIRIDGGGFANFPDSTNIMRKWHWLHLRRGEQSAIHLAKGLHRCRLAAWEDGVCIDKLVLAPAGERPERLDTRSAVFWDASIPSCLSFNLETQSQTRGTTQYATVWVRRNSPDLKKGRIVLEAPEPFQIVGDAEHVVAFAPGNPLLRTTYRVRLPEGAVAGEGYLVATYTDETGAAIEGRFILGAHYDWLCTGPLSPIGNKLRSIGRTMEPRDADLDDRWTRYPVKGYDSYRRLNFELAYGQLRNVWLLMVADIFVEKEGTYQAFLTADDIAYVFIDGRGAIAQPSGGPGEGRMVTNRVMLTRGRHRVFVRHYQADFADPVGPHAVRHSFNHCVFKLLIREDRHTPATAIRGLPMTVSKDRQRR